MPLVGWLLVYQNAFAEVIARAVGSELGVSLGWEVLVFYIGLVLLGVSAFSFRILAPGPILNHNGIQGYIEDMEAVVTRKQFKKFCAEANIETPEEIRVPAAGIGQVLDATREQWLRLNLEAIRDAFSDHYANENERSPLVRSAITLTFCVGACLTLVPTAATLVWVLRRLAAGH